ncbi:hypothetical protein SprV_0401646200 [Sparganum proliferum]
MHKLIVCCLLIAAVCATPARVSEPQERNREKNFSALLKHGWEQLLASLKKYGKELLKKAVPAFLEFAGDGDWGNLVSNMLEDKTQKLWKRYLEMKNEKKSALQFFRENGTDIVLAVLKFFGATGDDLTSVTVNALQDILANLLRTFVGALKQEEAHAVVGIFAGLVKVTIKIVTKSRTSWQAFSDFLTEDISTFARVLLLRLFNENGQAYNFIVKFLPSTKQSGHASA